MATFIAPLPSAFNHEAKDLASEFRYWRQCFNDFCAINKITDAQTLIKLFRSCVGRHIVTYLEDLPNYGQLTTVKQLLDTVENRYKKAVNVHAERLNFRSIGINPGESLLDYESRLNSFSKSCEFQNYDRDSAHLEMVLIAAPQKIKEKLLLTPDLTLDIAKNILKTMEVGTKWVSQASSIKLDNNNDVKIKQEVNFNLAKRDKQKGSNTSEAGGSRKRFACSRCGSNRHASNDKACPALGKKCNNCSLTGHFAQYCKTKASRIEAELAKSSKKATANKNPRQCNNIQANANDSNEENSDSAQIYSVATINKIDVKHKYMEVRLNGMPIKMLVDSGSNVTIVTAEVFNKIKFKGHKLALSAEKLMDCQSKEIPVLGEYSVEAQIGKDKFREKVLVTKLDKCLLGNSFITKMKNFDWNNFLTNSSELECNQINDTKAVFKRLQENDVLIKPEKCVFMTKEISYLGFKITDKGLFKTDEKIKAIKESLAPSNVSEVRSFLGLVTFYSKFVPNLATIAAPIYQLTRKNVPFDWNEECQKAFQSLKQELISNRFLTYFNPKLPLIVSCDASPVGLGAVLAHKLPSGEEKPIAYASRTLSNSERNYSQIDKESLAIIFAVKHFHFFLYGKDRFTIYTDHKPLISLFGEHAKLPTLVAARLQRWALTLSAYNYKIEHRTGANNGNADALSRKPLVQTNLNAQIDGTINNVLNIETIPFNVTYDEMVRETRKDRILSVVYDCLLKGRELPQSAEFLPYQRVKDQLNIDKECVLKANRVIVPVKLKDKVMQMLHSEHMGISKTKNLARYYVWWPKIDEDIENLVKSCEPCQLNRNDPEKHSSHSWQYPSNPWERIHIDFCGPFRNHMYLIVVDAYSKWPEVIRMSSSTSTSETIKVLLSLFARHGLPDKLVSDNGPQFTSDEFKEFMLNCGILHIKTAPYHPQTNGEAERFVQTFKNFVKRADHDKNLNQRQIDEAILKFLMTYRCTPHSGTEMSPSYLMLNRQIKNVFDLLRTKTSKIEIKNLEHQDKNCKAVSEYTEGESILFRNYNSQNKWEKGIVQKKIGSCIISLNITIKLSRNTWINSDQITLSQIQLRIQVTLFPKYLAIMSP